MFLKTTKSKNYTYLQLVESYREDGRIKHRLLFNLGRLDQLMQNDQLYRIACRMLLLSGKLSSTQHQELLQVPSNSPNIKEKGRYIYGHKVYHDIWQALHLDKILLEVQNQSKAKYDFASVVYYLVINRLLAPKSKLATYGNQQKYIGLPTVDKLHHVYHCLDLLAKHKVLIERRLFHRQKDLFNQNLDVIFYDLTTFHFESVRADELKNYGFSKAGKFNEVQVVLGLLVDQKGSPIGYELFEGNMSEKKTMTTILEKLAKRFAIQRIIIVADKGLNTTANLHAIRQAGYHYIVSKSLRQGVTRQFQQQVLDPTGYHKQYDKEQKDQLILKYKRLKYSFTYKDTTPNCTYNDFVLASWSAKRASKNHRDRTRQIQKATQLIADNKTSINNKRGAKRYMETKGQKQVTGIDQQKIKEDQKWDGYYAIQYSDPTLKPAEIMKQYHQLWRIEESFRVLKSTMKTRPIFHWTPKRIEGHFMLCFIAFLLERRLEITLKNKGLSLSPDKIKAALLEMQVSEIQIDQQCFYLKGKYGSDTKQILKKLRIAPIKNLTAVEQAAF